MYNPGQKQIDFKNHYSCLNSLNLASLNWSKLNNIIYSDLENLNAILTELHRGTELSAIGKILLNYLNPIMLLLLLLLNNDMNSKKSNAMNVPDSIDMSKIFTIPDKLYLLK